MAAVYLLALVLGVSLLSGHGTQLDLLHILFGSALGADNAGLLLVAGVATATILALACLYRGRVTNLRHADGGGPADAARKQRPPRARHTSRPVD